MLISFKKTAEYGIIKYVLGMIIIMSAAERNGFGHIAIGVVFDDR